MVDFFTEPSVALTPTKSATLNLVPHDTAMPGCNFVLPAYNF